MSEQSPLKISGFYVLQSHQTSTSLQLERVRLCVWRIFTHGMYTLTAQQRLTAIASSSVNFFPNARPTALYSERGGREYANCSVSRSNAVPDTCWPLAIFLQLSRLFQSLTVIERSSDSVRVSCDCQLKPE